MPQFSQGLGFDLADTFARDRERLPYFLERVIVSVIQAKAHPDDFFLARRKRLQHGRHLFPKIEVDRRVRRRLNVLVLDEVPEMCLSLIHI